jgi:hypothetical protein
MTSCVFDRWLEVIEGAGPDKDIWAPRADYKFGAPQTDILHKFVEHLFREGGEKQIFH